MRSQSLVSSTWTNSEKKKDAPIELDELRMGGRAEIKKVASDKMISD